MKSIKPRALKTHQTLSILVSGVTSSFSSKKKKN
jgi:hypothetical protein